MTAPRLLLVSVVLAATAIACSGRNEPPPPAAPQVAPPAVVAPPDDVAAVSSTLTEEKLKRLLAFEEEILPITAELVALSTMPAVTGGAEARRASGQPTREERARTLEAGIAAALQKHRLTPSDHAGFAGLTGSLVEGDAKVARAREVLALNEKKKVAWARIEAEDRKKKRDPRTPPASVTRGGERPLPEIAEQHLRKQIEEADADRRAFAARYGPGVAELLERYRAPILALREKQVKVALGSAR